MSNPRIQWIADSQYIPEECAGIVIQKSREYRHISYPFIVGDAAVYYLKHENGTELSDDIRSFLATRTHRSEKDIETVEHNSNYTMPDEHEVHVSSCDNSSCDSPIKFVTNTDTTVGSTPTSPQVKLTLVCPLCESESIKTVRKT